MQRFSLSSLAASLLAIPLALASPASAQDYPSRTVTIIVPFAPGGPTDALARQIAAYFQKKLGRTVVVENVSGAGSTIGTTRVARAEPDGHTLLVHNLAISANPSLYPKLAFDPEKNLTPVSFVNFQPLLLGARKDLPPKNLTELSGWLKSNVGRFGTPGSGSTGHLASALLAQAVGAKIDLVAYRGGAPALQDVVAGHIDFFFGTPQQLLEPIKGGLIKAYGVCAPEPLAELPDVPSFVKVYGPKLEILFWHGLFAPAGTPKPVIDKINTALQAFMEEPEILNGWREIGVAPFAKERRGPEAGKAFMRSEVERWGQVIRDNKITPQN
ncbi:MAG TPA: tripartite tricarboxylate transporter substrate binding protein [Xanthobacteraceae bacterium]|nr:tripartite tricarboxylate transporter substrate binding protein [Xanthobacteraceae bacterium]